MPFDVRNMPEGFGAAAFKDITNIHPLSVVAVVVLGVALILLPRRWAVLPMLIIACFFPSVQKITVFEMDFDLVRIIVLFGVSRLIFRKEYFHFSWKPLDIAVMLWATSSMVIYILQQGSFSAVINQLGFLFDVFGMYFLFRCLIQNWSDLEYIVFGFILISIPVFAFFLVENRTGRNLFSIFGGVPEITMIRDGRLRCQGAFAHPIIAGCFWASLLPLFAAFWWKPARGRAWAISGLIASLIIIFCCSSSTPLMGVIAAIVGCVFFYLRQYMRVVRWSVLLTLIALHLVMNAPVWHLISRVSAVGGSTSYFRYMLIDSAIKRFPEWALMGTSSTAHWFWGAQDMCNQYVYEGIKGGFLTLCFFVTVIVIAFREVGGLWRGQACSPYRLALSWALGVSLFVHCMNFIGVSYFGQIWILWYLLLAVIGSLSVQTKPLAISASRRSPR